MIADVVYLLRRSRYSAELCVSASHIHLYITSQFNDVFCWCFPFFRHEIFFFPISLVNTKFLMKIVVSAASVASNTVLFYLQIRCGDVRVCLRLCICSFCFCPYHSYFGSHWAVVNWKRKNQIPKGSSHKAKIRWNFTSVKCIVKIDIKL